MAASDARPVPRKNTAFRVTFPILDADGDLVTGAASLDSEVSIDGAAFADATAEATEIASASGVYYLDLTAGEMNGDTIAVIVKTATAGAKTTPIIIYPEEIGDFRADAVMVSGDQTAADNLETFLDGTGGQAFTGTFTGNLTGSVASVTGAVGSVTGGVGGSVTGSVGSVVGDVGGNLVGTVGSLSATAKSNVNAEVVDALATDTYAEPAAVVAATATLAQKIGWVTAFFRNKRTTTATTDTLLADDGTTTVATSTLSDDGTTFTSTEYV